MMNIEQAIALYLTEPSERTGDLRADLIAAGKRAARWRREGPEATRAVLTALRNEPFELTYRQIEAETGIGFTTAQRIVEGRIGR
jgi:hypothetical protein